MQPVKPGYASTEFYITLIVQTISAILALGIIPHSNEMLQVIGAIVALLSSFGYGLQRAQVKAPAPVQYLIAASTVQATPQTTATPVDNIVLPVSTNTNAVLGDTPGGGA